MNKTVLFPLILLATLSCRNVDELEPSHESKSPIRSSLHQAAEESWHRIGTADDEEHQLTALWYSKGRLQSDGFASMVFEDFVHGQSVAAAELYHVVGPEGDTPWEEWVDDLLASGAPDPSRLVVAQAEGLHFEAQGDRVTVLLDDWAFPADAPVYLRLSDSEGRAISGVLFGPPYEDSNNVHVTLDSMRSYYLGQ